MFDVSISVKTADRKSRGLSLVAGLLIAGSCSALLFVAMAHLIPLFLRFVESPQAGLLPAFCILSLSFFGLVVYFKRRGKKTTYRASKRSAR
jgi:hypothetical protein